MKIKRRSTRAVNVGGVLVGGEAPISIESMAKTDTKDVQATINQLTRLQGAGCEIARVAVRDEESARLLGSIRKGIGIPLVADIHFNYRLALIAAENGADALRLNPGNIKKPGYIHEILNVAKKRRIPIRIGVNSGSLRTPGLMVKEVLRYLKIFEREKFRDIIISLKSSDVADTIEANRRIARLCNYPIHLGVTAAGLLRQGMIKSAVGVGALLSEGIGDTIRISLTDDPVEEVETAKLILESLGLRQFGPLIIACPTCGRCQVDLVEVVKKLQNRLSTIHHPPSTIHPFKIAVMGCEVNGPGEARDADIGIAAGKKAGVLFKKGRIVKRIKEKDFVKEIVKELSL